MFFILEIAPDDTLRGFNVIRFSKHLLLTGLIFIGACTDNSPDSQRTGTNTENPNPSDSQLNWFDTLSQRQENPSYDTPENWQNVLEATVSVSPQNSGRVGSGFFIHPDGYLITNHHVVMDENTELDVGFSGGDAVYTAKLISTNQCDDVALLQIKNPKRSFPFLTLGERVLLGDSVWLAGYPGEREEVVLSQSNVAQNARQTMVDLLGTTDIFTVDERLGQGSSGGPVLNENQEVVGISYALDPRGEFRDQYAIHAAALEADLARMLRHKFVGGWGFQAAPTEESGILVNKIYPDSPAAKLGLEPNDLITRVEGVGFGNEPLRAYCEAMNTGQTDQEPLNVTVVRNGREYMGVVHRTPLKITEEEVQTP